MSATTKPKPTPERLKATRDGVHARCVVCGRPGPAALGLKFRVRDDGSVAARFGGGETFQGYDGLLHGGVLAAMADGAMTNCLFACGIVAVTAAMDVRFRHPVRPDLPLTVAARITRDSRPLYVLSAEIVQQERLCVRATGKFMEKRPAEPGKF